MARFEGANVEKLQGGLGNLATGTDNHVALIVVGFPVGAVATAVNNGGKGVAITSLFAAEELGITASFSANNNLAVYNDIEEFFRLAPEGTLYLFDEVTAADLKGFINQNKEIKGYGLHFAYDAEAPNLVTTINAHQTIINELALENRFIDFALLGADDLSVFTQDLTALTAPNVSVLIGCEKADGITGVGSALGMIAVRMINENFGSVNIEIKPRSKAGTLDYTLTDALLSKWVDAFITNGSNVDAMNKSLLTDLLEKGYILVAGYEDYAGFFFSGSNTCIDPESDFSAIEYNRTWNKAARIIRATLLPKVRGKFKKNPQTGFIASSTLGAWNGSLNKALEGMVTRDEISGFEAYVVPNQSPNNTTPCVVKANIVADGIVHKFDVKLGLTNSI